MLPGNHCVVIRNRACNTVRVLIHGPPAANLFVANHGGTALAVVKVVGNADHAHGGDVVGGRRLDGASAAHAAQHRDGDDGSVRGIHAVSVASDR